MKNITIRMPKTRVPTQRTTYFRTYVELPQDGDYHFVALEPYLDNPALVHHILFFGCDEYSKKIISFVTIIPFIKLFNFCIYVRIPPYISLYNHC